MIGYICAKIEIIIGFSNLYVEYILMFKGVDCKGCKNAAIATFCSVYCIVLSNAKQRFSFCVSKKNGVNLQLQYANPSWGCNLRYIVLSKVEENDE